MSNWSRCQDQVGPNCLNPTTTTCRLFLWLLKILYRPPLDPNLSAHRLAWLYTHGVWPILELDHINRTRDDNRISNLRLANRYINTRNTKTRKDSLSGVKGVRWHKTQARWESRIQHNHKPITIGYYGNLQDAVQARKIAEILLGW